MLIARVGAGASTCPNPTAACDHETARASLGSACDADRHLSRHQHPNQRHQPDRPCAAELPFRL